MEVLHCIGKQFRQLCILISPAGAVHTEPRGFHDHFTQNHFGMLDKIAVHTDTVLVRIQPHPIRLYVRHAVTFLQEDNVAGNFGASIGLKRIIWETNRSYQVSPLCQIFADSRIFLIHRSLGGNERHDSTWTDLIQCLAKEIIVDEPVVFIILFIPNLEVTKGYIADRYIKKAIRHLYLFKAVHHNTAVLIKLLGDSATDGIKLYAIDFAFCHTVRQHTDEIADAAGRLQNVSLLEAHLSKRLIHRLNNDRRGIKRGEGAGSGSGIFLLIKQRFQLQIFSVSLIEAIR